MHDFTRRLRALVRSGHKVQIYPLHFGEPFYELWAFKIARYPSALEEDPQATSFGLTVVIPSDAEDWLIDAKLAEAVDELTRHATRHRGAMT